MGDPQKPVHVKAKHYETLIGHAQSQLPEHHAKLRAAELHTVLVKQIKQPTAAFAADPFEKHKQVRGARARRGARRPTGGRAPSLRGQRRTL